MARYKISKRIKEKEKEKMKSANEYYIRELLNHYGIFNRYNKHVCIYQFYNKKLAIIKMEELNKMSEKWIKSQSESFKGKVKKRENSIKKVK